MSVKKITLTIVLTFFLVINAKSNVKAQTFNCAWIWSPFLNDYVCALNNQSCSAPICANCGLFTDQGSCETPSHSCSCPIATPTPAGSFHCTWTGSNCVVQSYGCTDISCANCSQFPDQASCEFASHMCYCAPPVTGTTNINWGNLYASVFPTPGAFGRLSTSTTIGTIISALLNFIFPIAGLLLLLYFIYGGFLLMTSGGVPQRAQAAKAMITTALTGFAIIFAAYWIVQAVGIMLGLGQVGNIF